MFIIHPYNNLQFYKDKYSYTSIVLLSLIRNCIISYINKNIMNFELTNKVKRFCYALTSVQI